MSTQIIVVHGVNYFEANRVSEDIAKSHNVDLGSVWAFDWDRLVPTPFLRGFASIFRPRALAEIGRGFISAANLGFVSPRENYAGLSGRSLALHNFVAMALQVALFIALSVVPIVLFWSVFAVRESLTISVAAIASIFIKAYLTLVLFILVCVGAAPYISKRQALINATARRFLLIAMWPAFVAALAVHGLLLMLLVLGVVFTVFGKFDVFGLGWVWSSVAIIGSLLLVSAIEHLVIHQINTVPARIIKLIADFIRYIGIREYREALTARLREHLTAIVVAHPGDEIIIISHSLGTIIVADFLLCHSRELRQCRSVDWLTMGSPINRLFARFFPDIFPAASQIEGFLARELPRLRWSNIYRYWDYVGTSLGLDQRHLKSYERCSNSWLSNPLTSHSGYWGDKNVSALFRHARTQQVEEGVAMEYTVAESWPTDLVSANPQALFTRLWRSRSKLAYYATWSLCIGFFTACLLLWLFGNLHHLSATLMPFIGVLLPIAFFRPAHAILKMSFGCDGPDDFPPLMPSDAKLTQEDAQSVRLHKKKYFYAGVLGAVLCTFAYYHIYWPFFSQWRQLTAIDFPVSDSRSEGHMVLSSNGRHMGLWSQPFGHSVVEVQSGNKVCNGKVPAPPFDEVIIDGPDHTTEIIWAAITPSTPTEPGDKLTFGTAVSSQGCPNLAPAQKIALDFRPTDISMSLDGRIISVAGLSRDGLGVIRIFDTRSHAQGAIASTYVNAADLRGEERMVLLNDNRTLAICKYSNEHGFNLVSTLGPQSKTHEQNCFSATYYNEDAVAISKDGNVWADGGYDIVDGRQKFTVSVHRAKPLETLEYTFPPVRSLGLSNDGNLLAVVTIKGISVVDLRSKQSRFHRFGHSNEFLHYPVGPAPVFSPDNKLLAVQVSQGSVAVFEWSRDSFPISGVSRLFRSGPDD